MTGPGGPAIEWILLAVGGVLTLALVGFFVFVLTRKDEPK